MANTNPSYCSASDLRDIYPQIDEFDTKTAIYGWELITVSSSHKVYISYNSGVVNQFYINGQERKQQTIGTQTAITGTLADSTDTSLSLSTSSHSIVNDSLIVIEDEILEVTNVSGATLTVVRGRLDTENGGAYSSKAVNIYFDGNESNQWMYDSERDWIIYSAENPENLLAESGENWKTHQTDIIQKASAYLDSRIDANLPRRQFKNSDGEYDYLIVRTTALITASFLIKAHNPTSELLEKFEEEYNFNIDLINSGKAKLSYQVSGCLLYTSPSTRD